MSDPVTFSRISSLSRLAVCPSSAAESEGKPSPGSDESALGQAFHEYMANHATEVHDDEGAYLAARDLARKHMCDEARLLALIEANTFDPEVGEREKPVTLKIHAGDGCPEIHVPGTADWVKCEPASMVPHPQRRLTWEVTVVDYKTNAYPEHALPITRDLQLHGYAVACADVYGAEQAVAVKYYPALGDEGYETCRVDLDDARRWLTLVIRKAWRAAQDEKARLEGYRPNNQDWSTACKGCPGVVSCEATRFAHKRALALIGREPKITRDNAVEVYEAYRLAGAAVKFKAHVGAGLVDLIDRHGPIDLDPGHEIRIVNGPKDSKRPQACKKEEVAT